MSAEVIQLGNGQFVAVSPISPYDANRMDANEEDDALSVSTTSTRERRHSFTVNSSINDNVLATSVQLFPPREHLLREGGSSPSRSNSRTSSPTDRRGLSASPQRGCRPSESLKTVEIGNLTLAETSFTDLKSPAPSTTSSRAPSSTSKVSQRRGTLLGPFMFMTKDTDKKLLERFSARDIKTMIKQLQLLEIQVKERHERDRLGLEEKILRSWHVVNELEESVKTRELEDMAAEDLAYTHNQLNHMTSLLERMTQDVVPVFEKLHAYHRLKTASTERRQFMKSVKSFHARTRTNQEYAEKALALEAAAQRLGRAHEKTARLLRGPLMAHIQRINSSSSCWVSPGPGPSSGLSPSTTTRRTPGKYGISDVEGDRAEEGGAEDEGVDGFLRTIGARRVSERDVQLAGRSASEDNISSASMEAIVPVHAHEAVQVQEESPAVAPAAPEERESEVEVVVEAEAEPEAKAEAEVEIIPLEEAIVTSQEVEGPSQEEEGVVTEPEDGSVVGVEEGEEVFAALDAQPESPPSYPIPADIVMEVSSPEKLEGVLEEAEVVVAEGEEEREGPPAASLEQEEVVEAVEREEVVEEEVAVPDDVPPGITWEDSVPSPSLSSRKEGVQRGAYLAAVSLDDDDTSADDLALPPPPLGDDSSASPPPAYASLSPRIPQQFIDTATKNEDFRLPPAPFAVPLSPIVEEEHSPSTSPTATSTAAIPFDTTPLPAAYGEEEISVLDVPDHHLDDEADVASRVSSSEASRSGRRRPSMKGFAKRTRSLLGLRANNSSSSGGNSQGAPVAEGGSDAGTDSRPKGFGLFARSPSLFSRKTSARLDESAQSAGDGAATAASTSEVAPRPTPQKSKSSFFRKLF